MPIDQHKNTDQLRLPDFLIIGAQKSGTTTVYRDLARQPGLFFPVNKEPSNLVNDAVLTLSGQQEYASLFVTAPENAKCGEASTTYTKLPDLTGVPDRAMQLLGKDLKLVYLMREPVSRAVSHFHHYKAIGLERTPVDSALLEPGPYIDYGRYAMQIEAWLEVFERACLCPVFFEDYMTKRQECVALLHAFLGATGEVRPINSESRLNKSAGRPVLKGIWRKISLNKTYRATLQKWVPWQWRRWVQQIVLPRGPSELEWPSAETVEKLLTRFSSDNAALKCMLGKLPDAWAPETVAARFAEHRETGR